MTSKIPTTGGTSCHDQNQTKETDVKDIFYRAGQVSVVRRLKEMQNDKKELCINAKNQSLG